MASLIAAALVACTPSANTSASPTSASTGSPIASVTASTGSASPAATSQVLLSGTLTTVDDDAQRFPAFADKGSLYAIWKREGPSPYLSRLERFDSGSRAWQRIFEDDASITVTGVDGGRAALHEYRETDAASDTTFTILDLASARTTRVDAFALSAATFHGGGGGPRRPGTGFALGGGRVAWARVNELAGGVTEGELRVAPISDPASFTVIGRSRTTIYPVWIDGSMLVYLAGGPEQDEIRARDLATGNERVVAHVIAPSQDRGPGGIAHSGSMLGWIENLPSGSIARGATMRSALHAVDLATAATVDLDLGTSTCGGLTGNALGFAWGCSPDGSVAKTLSYYDPRARRSVEVMRSSGVPSDLRAVDSGFLWFDFVDRVRTVNLLTLP